MPVYGIHAEKSLPMNLPMNLPMKKMC